MLDGIDTDRILAMTANEKRLLDNIKKAVFASDQAIVEGRAADRCLEELFKAIDAAKSLRRLLRGEAHSRLNQKAQFIKFIELEVPSSERGGMSIPLTDNRVDEQRHFSFGALVYDIRCMVVHENDTLNLAEEPDFHIKLDWSEPNVGAFCGYIEGGSLICNGYFFWSRLRQIIAKFVTAIDSRISFRLSGTFDINICPPLLSIRPVGTNSYGAPE